MGLRCHEAEAAKGGVEQVEEQVECRQGEAVISGATYDRRRAGKGEIYKMQVRPAIMYALEIITSPKKGGEAGAELKML